MKWLFKIFCVSVQNLSRPLYRTLALDNNASNSGPVRSLPGLSPKTHGPEKKQMWIMSMFSFFGLIVIISQFDDTVYNKKALIAPKAYQGDKRLSAFQ